MESRCFNVTAEEEGTLSRPGLAFAAGTVDAGWAAFASGAATTTVTIGAPWNGPAPPASALEAHNPIPSLDNNRVAAAATSTMSDPEGRRRLVPCVLPSPRSNFA